MPRLNPLTPKTAGKSAPVLEELASRHGTITNMVATMAHSPAVLEGYRQFQRSLKRSQLSVQLRELIALAVAEQNGCAYCLAAHTEAARRAGLSDGVIAAARRGEADDPADAAALTFALRVAHRPADVTDAEIAQLRELTFTPSEIAELIAAVALNQFTNAFNIVTGVELDTPRATSEERAA